MHRRWHKTRLALILRSSLDLDIGRGLTNQIWIDLYSVGILSWNRAFLLSHHFDRELLVWPLHMVLGCESALIIREASFKI